MDRIEFREIVEYLSSKLSSMTAEEMRGKIYKEIICKRRYGNFTKKIKKKSKWWKIYCF